MDTRFATLTRTIAIDADPFASLRAALTGELITPASAGFDDARRLVFINADRRPAAIVKAASAADVAATVRFAAEQELPLGVRSGGHSLAFFSVIDDGITIDLSGMKAVQIDPTTAIARVQAGATSGDLAGPAHKHGLALTTGDTASVGLGGLTTGGGVGFMVRKQGLTIDNLLAAEVVLASGEIVTASAMENADLFWAIRGGGGNFGIVTEFTFQLSPVGYIYGGLLALPATREVIRGYLEYTPTAPDDLTTLGTLMYAPPAPFVPQEHVGKLIFAILACWTGSMEEGGRALAPLRALGEPIADTLAPMPYPEIYRYTDQNSMPHGASIRMMFADELSDSALDACLEAMQRPSSPASMVHFRGLGGEMSRVAPEATAFAHRTQPIFFSVLNVWLDPADDPATHQTWTETLWSQVRHEGSGVYVNFLEEEGDARIGDAYPAATYARLAEIKRRYDPTNLFRNNQNIKPRA